MDYGLWSYFTDNFMMPFLREDWYEKKGLNFSNLYKGFTDFKYCTVQLVKRKKSKKKKEEKSVACSHNFIRQLDNRMVLFYVFMGKTSMYTIRVSAHVVVSALKS